MTDSRRGFLAALGAGTAGLALPAVAAASTGEQHASHATATSRRQASVATDYTTGVPYSDRKTFQDFATYGDDGPYTPSNYEERAVTSTIAHSGPQPIPGVPDEVQYTVVVSTTAATAYVDANREFVAGGENVSKIENHVDWPGDVARTQFPDDEDWVGGHRGRDSGDSLPNLRDDDTLVGAVFDVAFDFVTGAIPFVSEAFTVLDFVTDLADVYGDASQHTATFDYEQFRPESYVTTHRKFTLQLNRDDVAALSFSTTVDLLRKDDGDVTFQHELELDPDAFVSDVDGHPFEREIRTLVDEGVVSGYSDGTFRPERTLTRAEYAALLASAFDPNPATRPDFTDVGGHWAESAIRDVAGAGFFGGYPDGTFRPDETVSKLESIVALDSGLGYDGGDTSVVDDYYDDAADVPDWAREPVADVHEAWGGIENYPTSRSLDPLVGCTRAHAAKYVYEGTG